MKTLRKGFLFAAVIIVSAVLVASHDSASTPDGYAISPNPTGLPTSRR